MAFADTAPAATRNWTGNSSSYWPTAANWSGNATPGFSDDVTIDVTSPNAPTLDSSNGAASSIYIGNAAGSSGKLIVQNGANLSVGNVLHIGEYGNGVLIAQNGAAVTSGDGALAARAGSSAGAHIDGAGSIWQMSGFLTVGAAGPASLFISNGARVSDHGATTAAAAGASTAVLIDGTGSTWATGSVVIGAGDTATVSLSNGGSLSATGSVYLGGGSTGTGVLNIGADSVSPPAAPGNLSVNQKLFFGNATHSGNTLVFNHSDSNYIFAPSMAEYVPGSFGTIKVLAGTTHLSTNSVGYQGVVQISGGTLSVDNVLGGTQVSVTGGGILEGCGLLMAPVFVAAGGTLAPGCIPGTLTTGPLTLGDGAQLVYNLGTPGVAGGGANDLAVVNGALVLAGTLNIKSLSGFAAGTYRLMNYSGPLTDNGLQFGTLPQGFTAAQFQIDTSTTGQVNLIVNAAAAPVLAIAPTSLIWTNVPANSNGGAQSVTLTNIGNAPLTVSQISLPSAPFAANGGTCPAPPIVLAPGASCTLSYGFDPTAAGSFGSTITATSNAPSSQATFTLGGSAITTPQTQAAVSAPALAPRPLLLLALLCGICGAGFRRRRGAG